MPTPPKPQLPWHRADDPPDDELTVLLYMPRADEQIWPGYHSAGTWCDPGGDVIADEVTAWLDVGDLPVPG